jgi:hypothetical protein
MRADEPVDGFSGPWHWVKIGLALVILAWAASCSHTRVPGAIDTPTSIWYTWADGCQIHRACKPVEPMPRCSPDLVVSAASRAFTASKGRKDVRSVAGTLQSRDEGCTKMYCGDSSGRQRCCNGCEGHIVLVGEDGSIVGLTGEECVGDISRLCCTIDVHGQKIIATGVLVDEYERGQLWFKGPYDICAL